MVVRKEDIHSLVERLKEHDQKTAFDFLQYLIERSERKLPFGQRSKKLNRTTNP